MSKDLFVSTQLTRRQFHALINRLENDREIISERAQDFKNSDDKEEQERYDAALRDIRDIDMLIAALYEED